VMIVDSSATTGALSRSARVTGSEKTTVTGAELTGMMMPRMELERRPLSICTIGDLILDVVVLPDGPLNPDADTPATIRFTAGGQAANVAAWASALGARSRLVCKRGSDVASELAAAELVRHRVEICGPVVAGRGGVVVSIRDARGRRTMASDRGVASQLDAAELDPSWVRSCDVLHVSGYCLFRESMARATIEAARHAPRVTVDLASAKDIEIVGARRFVARLEQLAPELVFATEAERAAVPGFDATWVIKLGARGARFPEGLYPAPPVVAVDTTGAGDALAAGYLVGGPERAIEAASRSVGLIGAMPPAVV
jgi:sugar/nucleoside kinase (ribokinase family)